MFSAIDSYGAGSAIQKILADYPHVDAVWAEPGPDDGSNSPRR